MNFQKRYLEEAKQVDPKELQRAAGYDYVYTSNPKETIFSMLNPVKADAISMDDLEHRAKTLGIDKNFLEKNMAIRDNESSGYVVDDAKLAGFASRMHPEHINYFNTIGSPKRIVPGLLASGLLGAGLGAALGGIDIIHNGDETSVELANPNLVGAGAGIGAALSPLGGYMGYKQGQAIYDRMNKGKK